MKLSIAGGLIAASLFISHASLAQTGGAGSGAGGVGTAAGGNAAAASSPGTGGTGAAPMSAPATGGTAAPSASPGQVPSTVGVAPNSAAPSTYAPANGGGGGRISGARTDGRSEQPSEVVEQNEREVSKRIKSICKGC